MKKNFQSRILAGAMIGFMVFSPISVFADDGYTISYYDSINDYYAGTGNSSSYSGSTSGYYDTSVSSSSGLYSGSLTSEYTDYSGGEISGGAYGSDIIAGYNEYGSGLGSDVIYDNTSTPTTRLWSDEPLASTVTANQYRNRQKVKPISIQINGKKYTPRDTQPLLLEGRVFVPLRFVVEQLGYTVSWDAENLVAEINDGAIVIEIGSYTMWKYDGVTIPTDTPPFLYQGTLMVGLRQIGNALNYKVGWDSEERLVTLERAIPNTSLSEHNVFDRTK